MDKKKLTKIMTTSLLMATGAGVGFIDRGVGIALKDRLLHLKKHAA